MKKKFLSLFLALVMILGVIPANVLAYGEQKTCTITFKESEDVKNKDYGIYDKEGKGPFILTADNYYTFKNDNHDFKYYINGKRVGGVYLTEDTTVYVDYNAPIKTYYPEEDFDEKPNGYIVATFQSGKLGKFWGKESDVATERKFYVQTMNEVNLESAVQFKEINLSLIHI